MALGGSCVIALLFLFRIQLNAVVHAKVIPDHLTPLRSRAVDPWSTRLSTAWELLLYSPCKRLQYGENCTKLKSRTKSQMNVYTADKETNGKPLTTVLVEKVKGSFHKSDAVLVVDPYPNAHFGHTIILFLIEFVKTSRGCSRKGAFSFTGESFCATSVVKHSSKFACDCLWVTPLCNSHTIALSETFLIVKNWGKDQLHMSWNSAKIVDKDDSPLSWNIIIDNYIVIDRISAIAIYQAIPLFIRLKE